MVSASSQENGGKKQRNSQNPLVEGLFLSYESVLKMKKISFTKKIEIVKKGISKDQLASLKEIFDLEYSMLSKILGVTDRTLYLKKGEEVFNQSVSDRIMALAELYSSRSRPLNSAGRSHRLFKSRGLFHHWIKSTNRALGDVAPVSLLDTQVGMQEVKNELHRKESGIF